MLDTISDRVPTYQGPHGHLSASKPIPKQYIQEIRRAVAHSCVKTQGAFLAMLFDDWTKLRAYHASPERFDHAEFGKQRWQHAHRAICDAIARAGETPQIMQAYASDDHVTIDREYAMACQAVYGGE